MRTAPCLLTVAALTLALVLPGCARRDAVRVTAAVVGCSILTAGAVAIKAATDNSAARERDAPYSGCAPCEGEGR